MQEKKPLEGVNTMEEKIPVNNNHLEKVTGGNETEFYDGKPACPICGKYPIRLVESDEFTDTYQCSSCGQRSYHHKNTNKPDTGPVACPRCGSLSFQVIRSEFGIDTMECRVCRNQWTAPKA